MSHAKWTDEELAIVKRVYEDDSIGTLELMATLVPLLPNHPGGSIGVTASQRGWAQARKARRRAAGKKATYVKIDPAVKLQRREDRKRATEARHAERRAAAERERRTKNALEAIETANRAIRDAKIFARDAGLPVPFATPAPSLDAPARAVASPVSARATVTNIRAGKCDRGDRNAIVKRLANYVIPQLARELGRSMEDIERAIGDVVRNGFKPEASTFGPNDYAPEESTHARRAG